MAIAGATILAPAASAAASASSAPATRRAPAGTKSATSAAGCIPAGTIPSITCTGSGDWPASESRVRAAASGSVPTMQTPIDRPSPAGLAVPGVPAGVRRAAPSTAAAACQRTWAS